MYDLKRNVHWHQGKIVCADRERLNTHRGSTIWFTGLSASGKSTLAVSLEKQLFERECHTYILDGDNIRHGLNKDLGFSPEDRAENIRRIAEVSAILRDCGIINMVAFISPYREDRNLARLLCKDQCTFVEVFVDCPVDVCEVRDPKGMYRKARMGEIKEFTGISAPYEPPLNPEIHLRTDKYDVDACTSQILDYMIEKELICR